MSPRWRLAAAAVATLSLSVSPSAEAIDGGVPPSPPPVGAPSAPSGAGASDAGAAAIVIDPPAPGAPVVTAAVAASEVSLGRKFLVVVTVTYPPGMEVNLPASLNLPGFEEVGRTNVVRDNGDGTRTREFEVSLMAFTVGDVQIPPFPVTYAAGGRAATARSNPIALRVVGVLTDDGAELRDIAPPVEVRRRDFTLIYIAAAVLAALVLAALLYTGLRKRKPRRRRRGRAGAAPRLSAEREALVRLAEIEASGKLDAGNLKPVYLAMSDVLKTFLGRRFDFPAPELTTVEITRHMANVAAAAPLRDELAHWLSSADLVKFANRAASPDEARAALYSARRLVQVAAKPVAPAPSPAAQPDVATGGAP